MYFKFLLCLIVVLLICCSKQVHSDAIKNLRSDLLKSYDPVVRPVLNESTTVNVRLLFLINQILDIDVKKQFFWLDGIIVLKWVDEHMKWNPDDYEGQDRVVFDANEVWKPEINVWNSNAEILPANSFAERSSVSARSNGSMFWWTYITIASKCALDLTDYPFDIQRCQLFFGPNTYHLYEMDFINPNSLSIFGPMTRSPQFAVINATASRQVILFFNQTKYSCIQFSIQVRRRVALFDYYVTIPHWLSVLFAVAMFVTSSKSNYRLVFAFLSIFLHFTILFMISQQLGMRSLDVPRMVKIIGAHLTLVGLALSLSFLIKQFLIQILMTLPPLPRYINHFTGSTVLCRFLFISTDSQTEEIQVDLEKNHQYHLAQLIKNTPKVIVNEWIILINMIDRFLFFLYIILSLCFHV